MLEKTDIEQTLSFDLYADGHMLSGIADLQYLEDSGTYVAPIGFDLVFKAVNNQYNGLRFAIARRASTGPEAVNFFTGEVPIEALPSLRAMIGLILGDTK